MALLASATIIVEAADGSGSLHQGWEALRLGRPLFLLASAVQRPGLTWPDSLLQYGAQVIPDDDADAILDVLPDPAIPLAGAFAF